MNEPGAAAPAVGARKWLWFAVKLVVSAALITWIVSGANLAAVGEALARVDYGWLALAAILQFIGAAILTFRWQGLLAAKGVRPGFAYLYTSVIVASFFRQFLPSTLGGDAIRAYDAHRAGTKPGLAVVSLVLERLLGLVALLFIALAAILIFSDLGAAIPGIRGFTLLGLAGLVGLVGAMILPDRFLPGALRRIPQRLPKPIGTKLSKAVDTVRTYRGHNAALAGAFGLSLLLTVNVITFYWILAQSLGLGLDYSAFYAIVPLAVMVMMAPITINGIGLRETAFIFLLGLWAIDEPLALAFAWLEYGTFLGFGLFGGLVYAFRRR